MVQSEVVWHLFGPKKVCVILVGPGQQDRVEEFALVVIGVQRMVRAALVRDVGKTLQVSKLFDGVRGGVVVSCRYEEVNKKEMMDQVQSFARSPSQAYMIDLI
jgi:hypothetical protein